MFPGIPCPSCGMPMLSVEHRYGSRQQCLICGACLGVGRIRASAGDMEGVVEGIVELESEDGVSWDVPWKYDEGGTDGTVSVVVQVDREGKEEQVYKILGLLPDGWSPVAVARDLFLALETKIEQRA
jgi:hypothetical protein